MIKSVLNILMFTLLFGSNVAFGQECKPNTPLSLTTSGYNEICSDGASVERSEQPLAARELSSEELDQIVGEGPTGFIVYENSSTGSVAGIILWDEISTRTNGSMADSIVMKSGGALMQGVQVNGLIE